MSKSLNIAAAIAALAISSLAQAWAQTESYFFRYKPSVMGATGGGGGSPVDATAPVWSTGPSLTPAQVGQAYGATVLATDDSGTVTYSITSAPAWISINGATGTFSGTPGAADMGTTSVVIEASDAVGNTSNRTFTIPVGDTVSPVWTGTSTVSLEVGTPLSFALTASDDTAISFTKVSGAAWISIDGSGSVLTGTPSATGPHNVTIRATDTSGNESDRVITVNVVDTTPPVFAVIPPQTGLLVGQVFSALASATDASGTVTYSRTSGPLWMSVNPATGMISGTIPPEATGATINYTITATDPSGNFSQRTSQITVDAAPPPP